MSNFRFISDGLDGTTPGIRWIEFDDGRRGVFKPWDKKAYEAETAYFRVAEFFNLPVSKCILVDGGFASMQSYNKRMTQVAGYDIQANYCLDDLASVLSESIVRQLVVLMYVDAVCNHTDRHEGNLAVLSEARGNIIEICPVYDNCNCFGNSYGNKALLTPDFSKGWTHRDVFYWLHKEYPEVIQLTVQYASVEFDTAVQGLYYTKWILENRQRLLSAL